MGGECGEKASCNVWRSEPTGGSGSVWGLHWIGLDWIGGLLGLYVLDRLGFVDVKERERASKHLGFRRNMVYRTVNSSRNSVVLFEWGGGTRP